MKPLIWVSGSKADWLAFPESVQHEGGFQLDKVQRGERPSDWRPMTAIGPGVLELRIRDVAGAFRVIYLATRPEGVYVLHAFQKKTQTTSLADLRLAQARLKTIRS